MNSQEPSEAVNVNVNEVTEPLDAILPKSDTEPGLEPALDIPFADADSSALLSGMPRISDFVTESSPTVGDIHEATDGVLVSSTPGADGFPEPPLMETAADAVVTAVGLARAMSDMGMDDVDPNQDVAAELASLDEADQERMVSLREMAAAEGLPMTDAQLLTFLKRIRSLNESVKKLTPKKRQSDHKVKAKRRAQTKMAKESRKRNRGR